MAQLEQSRTAKKRLRIANSSKNKNKNSVSEFPLVVTTKYGICFVFDALSVATQQHEEKQTIFGMFNVMSHFIGIHNN